MFGAGIVTEVAWSVADCSPSATSESALGEGARRAVPSEAIDEWPECPSTGPEPSTAFAAVARSVPDPDFPTPFPDCAFEKADEGFVSNKRRES